MAGLRLHSPMLRPEHYCSQRRVRGQSDWLSFLCKTLSFSVSGRFIPALSLTPFTRDYFEEVLTRLPGMKASEAASLTPANWHQALKQKQATRAA